MNLNTVGRCTNRCSVVHSFRRRRCCNISSRYKLRLPIPMNSWRHDEPVTPLIQRWRNNEPVTSRCTGIDRDRLIEQIRRHQINCDVTINRGDVTMNQWRHWFIMTSQWTNDVTAHSDRSRSMYRTPMCDAISRPAYRSHRPPPPPTCRIPPPHTLLSSCLTLPRYSVIANSSDISRCWFVLGVTMTMSYHDDDWSVARWPDVT